jgi:hypothetical protein
MKVKSELEAGLGIATREVLDTEDLRMRQRLD